MAGYFMSKELNKINFNEELNTDNLFGVMPILNFIIDKYKQILLFILMFIIIYVVEHITYYNSLFNGITNSVPGLIPQQNNSQSNQIKSNTFKKHRKHKK